MRFMKQLSAFSHQLSAFGFAVQVPALTSTADSMLFLMAES
jgi:hypothetical protein